MCGHYQLPVYRTKPNPLLCNGCIKHTPSHLGWTHQFKIVNPSLFLIIQWKKKKCCVASGGDICFSQRLEIKLYWPSSKESCQIGNIAHYSGGYRLLDLFNYSGPTQRSPTSHIFPNSNNTLTPTKIHDQIKTGIKKKKSRNIFSVNRIIFTKKKDFQSYDLDHRYNDNHR